MSIPQKLSQTMRAVLQVLHDADGPLTPDAISVRASLKGTGIINTLYSLLRRGMVYQLQNHDATELFGCRPWALSAAGREFMAGGGVE